MEDVRGSVLTRVGPLGVVAVIWVAIAILFPTQEPDSSTASVGTFGGGGALVPSGSAGAPSTGAGLAAPTPGGASVGATPAPGSSSAVTPGGGGSQAGTAAPAVGSSGQPSAAGSASTPATDPASGSAAPVEAPTAAPAQATGSVTRDGRECADGVRQIPISRYATNCLPVQSGDNGGATWRGVTGDEIVIVERRYPQTANSQAVAAVNESAGIASDEQQDEVNAVFREYLNANMELYGRTVKWVVYESQYGNATNEAQSQGREEACLDADVVANELGAFAVVGPRNGAVSGPFTECAAERGVVVLNGAAYFPERFYAERHPYAWAYTMECERITVQVSEYIGKRLGTKNAQWAGDPLLQASPRRYGVYVPNNDQYQFCVDKYVDNLARDWGIDGSASRYNYTLDVSRFPDEAARGAVQFKADGITTVVMACDPISAIFLTQAATKQAYFPEWLLIGVAAQDTDLYASLYDQQNVEGSLFGLSQLGETDKLVGPGSEPGDLYKHITGKDIYDGASGGYIQLMMHYSMLQNAGPALTPDAIAAGVTSIPIGGAPDFAFGMTSFATDPEGRPGIDHTWVDDSREIYWDSDALTFIATYDGKRFTNGEWPAENPPIYPEG